MSQHVDADLVLVEQRPDGSTSMARILARNLEGASPERIQQLLDQGYVWADDPQLVDQLEQNKHGDLYAERLTNEGATGWSIDPAVAAERRRRQAETGWAPGGFGQASAYIEDQGAGLGVLALGVAALGGGWWLWRRGRKGKGGKR